MRVSKWSNSLAIRIPSSMMNALDLHEGEEIEFHLSRERSFEIVKKSTPKALLHRLHQLRGNLPADFPFDFMQTNERTDVLWAHVSTLMKDMQDGKLIETLEI